MGEFKTNWWKPTEWGGLETFIGLTSVEMRSCAVNYLENILGVGTDKFSFYMDYIFHYLEWNPGHDIVIFFDSRHGDTLGYYFYGEYLEHAIFVKNGQGWMQNLHKFQILMNNLSVLGHEMVHAWQQDRGDFFRSSSGGSIFWKGDKWDEGSHEWGERPWEQEASKVSAEILQSFVNMMNSRGL
jgi:hypothetical protein